MTRLFGRHIGLVALILLVGLALPVLFGGTMVSADGLGPSVRMAVDPTVLPPVQLPGAPAEPGTEATPTPSAEPGAEAKPASPPEFEVELMPDTPPASAKMASQTPTEPPVKPVESTPVVAGGEPPTVKPEPKAAEKPALSGSGTVRGVALESTDHGFVLTLTCDRPVGDTTYLNLTNPRRLVVDIRQPWKLGTRNVIRSAAGVVKHVVVGEHRDRLRFVIHFRTLPKSGLDPVFRRTGNSLVVTVEMP